MPREQLPIHPDWLAEVERDGRLTVSARVSFTAKTGLTHLAAAEDLARVREFLLAEADVAVRRLTKAKDPKSLVGLKNEERANP